MEQNQAIKVGGATFGCARPPKVNSIEGDVRESIVKMEKQMSLL